MKFFKWRGCLQFEEYADRTIDRVARKIAEGAEFQAAEPSAFFYGVATHLLRDYWRKSAREPETLVAEIEVNDLSGDPETIRELTEQRRQREMRFECLRRCLRRLPSESVELIKRYYSEGDVLDKAQRKELAERLSLSSTALRSRAFRIRGELEQCVNDCLQPATVDHNSS